MKYKLILYKYDGSTDEITADDKSKTAKKFTERHYLFAIGHKLILEDPNVKEFEIKEDA